jgi:quinol monooxygenase YgiN
MSYGHIAQINAPAGRREDLYAILAPQLDLVPDETGTLLYIFADSADAPDTIFSYERYLDEDAFQAHRNYPGKMQKLIELGITHKTTVLDLHEGGKGLPQLSIRPMVDPGKCQDLRGKLARWVTGPGDRTRVLSLTADLLNAARRDADALLYLIHTGVENPHEMWSIAIYRNESSAQSAADTIDTICQQERPSLAEYDSWNLRIRAAKGPIA